MGERTKRRRAAAALAWGVVVVAVSSLIGGCDSPPRQAAGGRLQVVAAENVWGSIAAEIGGARVDVHSIIANRNTDPHEYEPTVADARAIADASVLVVNGAGYDRWAGQLALASPEPSRTVLDVGAMAGTPSGGNPHLWYAPDVVHAVASRLAERYSALDPPGAAYYAARLERFRTQRLGRYDQLVAEIRTRYAGTEIGASESIFVPMARALGLRIATPEAFIDAVSEGTDPTAASKARADKQIRSGEISVFVYNDQNATPDVLALVRSARARHIAVVTVSETIPTNRTFSEWQTAQLEALRSALGKAGRR